MVLKVICFISCSLNPDKWQWSRKTCIDNIVGTDNVDDIASGWDNDDDGDNEDDEPQSRIGKWDWT